MAGEPMGGVLRLVEGAVRWFLWIGYGLMGLSAVLMITLVVYDVLSDARNCDRAGTLARLEQEFADPALAAKSKLVSKQDGVELRSVGVVPAEALIRSSGLASASLAGAGVRVKAFAFSSRLSMFLTLRTENDQAQVLGDGICYVNFVSTPRDSRSRVFLHELAHCLQRATSWVDEQVAAAGGRLPQRYLELHADLIALQWLENQPEEASSLVSERKRSLRSSSETHDVYTDLLRLSAGVDAVRSVGRELMNEIGALIGEPSWPAGAVEHCDAICVEGPLRGLDWCRAYAEHRE